MLPRRWKHGLLEEQKHRTTDGELEGVLEVTEYIPLFIGDKLRPGEIKSLAQGYIPSSKCLMGALNQSVNKHLLTAGTVLEGWEWCSKSNGARQQANKECTKKPQTF